MQCSVIDGVAIDASDKVVVPRKLPSQDSPNTSGPLLLTTAASVNPLGTPNTSTSPTSPASPDPSALPPSVALSLSVATPPALALPVVPVLPSDPQRHTVPIAPAFHQSGNQRLQAQRRSVVNDETSPPPPPPTAAHSPPSHPRVILEDTSLMDADPNTSIICRICEEYVRAGELKAHSAVCLDMSRLSIKISWLTVRLEHSADALRKIATAAKVQSLESGGTISSSHAHIETLIEICRATVVACKCEDDPNERVNVCLDRLVKLGANAPTILPHVIRIRSQIEILQKRLQELSRLRMSLVARNSLTVASAPDTTPRIPRLRFQGFDDFEKVRFISKGGYGKVILARKKRTGDLYAIKVMEKRVALAKNFIDQIRAEHSIMADMDNPWVVKLYYSFQTSTKLCLVMEYLNGGDLLSLIKNMGYLSEEHASFYIAETALAIHSLHRKGIIHRDIKPDNIVIASDGHIRLTDFGLSRMGAAGTYALAADHGEKARILGTPDYVAPEILLNVGDDEAVDWWSLGVVCYEMLTGVPPFNSSSPEAIFDNILHRRIEWPSVPDDMSFAAQDLIAQLLTPNPSERLNFIGIQSHSFFKDIDWENIRLQAAPFVPDQDSWYFEDRLYGDDEAGSFSSGHDMPDQLLMKASLSQSDSDIDTYSFGFLNLKNLDDMNNAVLEGRRRSSVTAMSRDSGSTAAVTSPLPRRLAVPARQASINSSNYPEFHD